MKQKKVNAYRPAYTRKAVKGMALAAAALMAMGGAGCRARMDNAANSGPTVPPTAPATEAPEELVLDGEVGIEIPPENLTEPGEPIVDEPDDPVLEGKVAVDAPEIEVDPGSVEDEPVLEGEPAVDENGDIIMDGPAVDDEYGDPLLGGEPLPDPSWEEENDPAEDPTPDEPEERDGEEPALMGKIAVPEDMP